MLYLIQSIMYAGVLYGIYLAFLRNLGLHSFNRFYLLLVAVLSLLLPLLRVPAMATYLPYDVASISNMLPEINIRFGSNTRITTPDTSGIFAGIYLSVSIVLLLITVARYYKFYRFAARKQYHSLPGNIRLITDCGYGPGSIGKYIFFPGKETDPNILQHETAHVQHKHSYDNMLLQLLQCIFWPQIMLYVIQKELKIIHEFEADANIQTDKDQYARLLLNDVFGTQHFSIAHTFFHHPLNRRINMLHQKSKSRKTLRNGIAKAGLATALLLTGMVYLQSCERKPDMPDKQTEPSSASLPMKDLATTEQYTFNYVEQMPEPTYNLLEYIFKNIKYPDEARDKNITGRVIVKFIVDEEGNITDPVVLRSPDKSLSDESLRVIRTLPKWNPGKKDGKNVRVYFTLPIKFSLG